MVSSVPNFWSRWKEKRCLLIHSGTSFYESCWAESEIALLCEAHFLRSNRQKDEIMQDTGNRHLISPNLGVWRSQKKSGKEPQKIARNLLDKRQNLNKQGQWLLKSCHSKRDEHNFLCLPVTGDTTPQAPPQQGANNVIFILLQLSHHQPF